MALIAPQSLGDYSFVGLCLHSNKDKDSPFTRSMSVSGQGGGGENRELGFEMSLN